MKRNTRQIFSVSPPASQYLDLTDAFEENFEKFYRCGGQFSGLHGDQNRCIYLDEKFAKSQCPIDAVVKRNSSMPWIHTSPTTLTAIRSDLWDILQPYFPPHVIGRLQIKDSSIQNINSYITVYCNHEHFIDYYRGAGSLHNQCPKCRGIHYLDASIRQAIVGYSLGEAMVFTDDGLTLSIDGDLILKLRLKERFPELRFRRIPVIANPMDDDILPGDPEWSGTFVASGRWRCKGQDR